MDDKWHRAIIENVQDGFISKIRENESLYTVPIPQTIPILPASFRNLPALAVFVKLHNTAPEVRYMQKASNNYTLVVKNVTQGYVEQI